MSRRTEVTSTIKKCERCKKLPIDHKDSGWCRKCSDEIRFRETTHWYDCNECGREFGSNLMVSEDQRICPECIFIRNRKKRKKTNGQ